MGLGKPEIAVISGAEIYHNVAFMLMGKFLNRWIDTFGAVVVFDGECISEIGVGLSWWEWPFLG